MGGNGLHKRRDQLALLVLVPAPSLGLVAGMVVWPGTALGQAAFAVSKVWLLALPLVWQRWVDRQPLSLSPPVRGGLRVGAMLGVALGAVIGLAYLGFGRGLLDADLLRGAMHRLGLDRLPVYVGCAAYWVTVNSLLEEYVWRWFVFRKCESWLPPAGAVLASAGAFTVHHVVALRVYSSWPLTLVASAGVFAGGAIWSWCYLRYRSVWPGYVSHALADLAVFVIGYALIFG